MPMPTTSPADMVSGSMVSSVSSTMTGSPQAVPVAEARTYSHRGVMTATPNDTLLGLIGRTRGVNGTSVQVRPRRAGAQTHMSQPWQAPPLPRGAHSLESGGLEYRRYCVPESLAGTALSMYHSEASPRGGSMVHRSV